MAGEFIDLVTTFLLIAFSWDKSIILRCNPNKLPSRADSPFNVAKKAD
jgi:hypothetical protein